MKKIKKIDKLEKIQEKFNHQNTKMIETESELNEKKIINLEDNNKELKKNSLINKYKQEIQKLKKN